MRFNVESDDAVSAYTLLQSELKKVREGQASAPAQTMTFSAFAVSLFEEKVDTGEIKSASGRMKWAQVLEHHLRPAFGTMLVDQIRHADVAAWRVRVASRINQDGYSPHSANTWLNVMRVIMKAAVVRFELGRNAMDGIKNFDTSEHGYTEEEPNSLTVEEMPAFLSKMRELYPNHFAFVCLGFFWGIARRPYDRFGGPGRPPTSSWMKGFSSSGNPTRRARR